MAGSAWPDSGGNVMMREGNQKDDPGCWDTHIWGTLGSAVESLWHARAAAGLLDSCGSTPPLLSPHQLIMLLTWGFFWQTLLELPVLTRRPSSYVSSFYHAFSGAQKVSQDPKLPPQSTPGAVANVQTFFSFSLSSLATGIFIIMFLVELAVGSKWCPKCNTWGKGARNSISL